ncbi:MAG: prepilin peptidase [Bacilli bacterium]|nr:prepilin peptidase [Bacilli bacterium]
MNIYYIILFFILGTVFGSFYNVIGFRLPKGESIIKPKRSYCPTCRHALGTLELVPVFSFLFLGGKCKHCRGKISIFYPFIELLAGALFAVSYYSFGISWDLVIALSLVSLFSIVIVSDLNYLMIPDEVTFVVGIIISLSILLRDNFDVFLKSLGSGVLLFTIMYGVMLFGDFLFKKESLGGADIKLMFIAGLVLEPLLGVCVIFVSSVVALPVSILLYAINKEKVIPFGPFIVFSILLLFFLKVDVSKILNLFLM